MLPGRRTPQGALYVTAGPPPAGTPLVGGIAVRPDGTIYVNGLDQPFSPISLFAAGEQGVWYDPSDLTTMFQDRAGTTPVTADGQTVGLILDKSQGLVLGPELVVNGEFATGTTAGFTEISGNVGGSSVILGELNVVTASDGSGGFTQDVAVTQGATYLVSVKVRKISGAGNVRFQIYDGNSFTNLICQLVDISTVGAQTTYTARVKIALTGFLRVYLYADTSTTGGFDNISVKEIAGNHATAPNDAARPLYKTDGTYHWLQFDGVDDGMRGTLATPINNAVTLVVGAKANALSAAQQIVEISATDRADSLMNIDLQPTGIFTQVTGLSYSYEVYSLDTSNTLIKAVRTIYSPSPSVIRRDGIVLASAAGTGWPDAPLTLLGLSSGGGAGSAPANIYSLIIRGALSTAQEITDTETWVNDRTGAY